MLTIALLLHAQPAIGLVRTLHPSNWHEQLASRTWMVMFAVTGCRHCEQMRPMWEEMARQLADSEATVHVGRVNSTEHNGIARTMRVRTSSIDPHPTGREQVQPHCCRCSAFRLCS